MCFVVIVLGKAVYFFCPLPFDKSRLSVKPNADGAPIPNAGGASADADVQGIVIGSTWRRCSASRAVAESSLAVADYLLGQYDIFFAICRTEGWGDSMRPNRATTIGKSCRSLCV